MHAQFAQSFAQALVKGDYAAASQMLTPEMAQDWPAFCLQSRYEEMTEYMDRKPDETEVIVQMEDWPARQPTETRWVYVAIHGDEGSEAVTVVIDEGAGVPRISQIEWGRP